jgi:two-component system OmpR family response regulator
MSDHLLIVDDDPGLRELLADYLTATAFRVSTAWPTVAVFGRRWSRESVDLVILDLMLPGDDGLVLCRNLRARSQSRSSC